jgi:hypothetical protein
MIGKESLIPSDPKFKRENGVSTKACFAKTKIQKRLPNADVPSKNNASRRILTGVTRAWEFALKIFRWELEQGMFWYLP